MRATGPRKMETYRVKICDSEEVGIIQRRKQEKWLRIAGVENRGASLKKLMEFMK